MPNAGKPETTLPVGAAVKLKDNPSGHAWAGMIERYEDGYAVVRIWSDFVKVSPDMLEALNV